MVLEALGKGGAGGRGQANERFRFHLIECYGGGDIDSCKVLGKQGKRVWEYGQFGIYVRIQVIVGKTGKKEGFDD